MSEEKLKNLYDYLLRAAQAPMAPSESIYEAAIATGRIKFAEELLMRFFGDYKGE